MGPMGKDQKRYLADTGNIQNVGGLILRFNEEGKLQDHSHGIFPLTNDIQDSPRVAALLENSKKSKIVTDVRRGLRSLCVGVGKQFTTIWEKSEYTL